MEYLIPIGWFKAYEVMPLKLKLCKGLIACRTKKVSISNPGKNYNVNRNKHSVIMGLKTNFLRNDRSNHGQFVKFFKNQKR